MKHEKPNILLIMSDQHRMDCLGCYGNQDIQTPSIDYLAEDSVVYENSFCAAPVCTPSRYSAMTGMYPHQHQGWTNKSTIPSGTDTFPKLLKEGGYRTKAVGKMHFTPTYLDVGFDEMELAEQNGDGRFEDDYHHDLKNCGLIDKNDLVDQVEEFRDEAPQHYWDTYGAYESNLPEKNHSTTWVGEKALQTIGEWQGDANFLMASFIKPHHPFDPPKPWSDMYEPDNLSLLPGWTKSCLPHDLEMHKGFFLHEGLTEDKLKRVMSYYYSCISQIDAYVGKMIDLLKKKGMYDDTVIIYTSDHGEYMGFHHLLLKNNNMYDPLVKVPLIIKYPHQRNGMRSNSLVSNIDLAPTILSQANCLTGEHTAGIDLKGKVEDREFVFTELGQGRQYMARSKTHKLLLSRQEEKSMFFDLQKDPMELTNVYYRPEYGGHIKQHKQALMDMILFDAPAPVHLDRNALSLKNDDGHGDKTELKDMKKWVREKMKQKNNL